MGRLDVRGAFFINFDVILNLKPTPHSPKMMPGTPRVQAFDVRRNFFAILSQSFKVDVKRWDRSC